MDKIPATLDNKSFLDQCWEPGSSIWRDISLIEETGRAHCKVENLIIQTFRKAWLVHEPLSLGYALVNSPLSGKSLKRGRNLLSFAAFNGFRRLALWGTLNGSDINQGDADMTTVLGTAVADKEPYMADFGLFYLKADPNTVYGKENQRVTALRDAANYLWPVNAIASFIESGAVVRDQAEFEFIQSYFVHMADDSQHKQLKAKELIHSLYISGSLINPGITQKPVTIYTDMLQAIDRHILYAIKYNQITQEDIDSFQAHGRNFYHFLAFNGLSQTIKYLLHYGLAPEHAKESVAKRDSTGFDMLLAAIHGNNVDAVIEVLNVSDLPINLKVPSFVGYKNKGKKPLDLAREWQASPEVIKLLIKKGATPLVQ